MDVEINQNKIKKDFSLNYIYKKHLKKYLPENQNAIEYFQHQKNINKNLKFYNTVVSKNIVAKTLFKIIIKIS